jgi:hypothetical protein
MAQTANKVVGTVVSSTNWTSFTTTRITVSNNTRATTSSTTGASGVCRNFNFGVPAGATIDEVHVAVEFSTSNASSAARIKVRLSKDAGSNWGNYTSEASNSSTTDTTNDFTCVLTGLSLTASDVNDNTNFYIDVTGISTSGTRQCRVDYVYAYIVYTELSTGRRGRVVIY